MNGEACACTVPVHDAQGHATRLASEPYAWFLPPQVISSASVTDERIKELHEKLEEALATCKTEAKNVEAESVEEGPQTRDQNSNMRQLNGQILRLKNIVMGVKQRQDVVEKAQVSITGELKQISDAGAADKAKQAADNAEQDKTIKVLGDKVDGLGDKVEEHGATFEVQVEINEANTANQEAQGCLNEVVFDATNELKGELKEVASNVEKVAADNALMFESLKVQGERLEVHSEVNKDQLETNQMLEEGLKQVAAEGAADADNQDNVNAAQNKINLEQHEINKKQSKRIAELEAEIKEFAAAGADKIYNRMADSHMELAEVKGHPQQLKVTEVKLVVSK